MLLVLLGVLRGGVLWRADKEGGGGRDGECREDEEEGGSDPQVPPGGTEQLDPDKEEDHCKTILEVVERMHQTLKRKEERAQAQDGKYWTDLSTEGVQGEAGEGAGKAAGKGAGRGQKRGEMGKGREGGRPLEVYTTNARSVRARIAGMLSRAKTASMI